MARPTTFEEAANNDLYEYTINRFKALGNLDLNEMLTNSNLMKAWSDFVKALQHNGFGVVNDGYANADIKFTRELTPEEKEEQLRYAQNRWDELAAIWDACDATNSQPESYRTREVAKWAKQEGKDIPWERADFEVKEDLIG